MKKDINNVMTKKIFNFSNCIFIAVFASFFIFKEVWINFINDFFVNPFLSKIFLGNVGIDLTMLFSGLFFGLTYFSIYGKNLFISVKRIVISCVIIFVYICCRNSSEWTFTPFHLMKHIFYLDTLLIPPALELINSARCYYRKQKEKMVSEVEGIPFLFDTPSEEDTTQRKQYAEFIYNCLIQTFESNKSTASDAFSIGIIGSWGSGKTSFLRLLQKNLKEHNNIYFEFKPWLCSSTNEILTEFFNSLQENLSPYNTKIKKQTSRYLDKLLSTESLPFVSIFSSIRDFSTGVGSAYSEYGRLKCELKKLNKPIFVFIDDLDRLTKNEIGETLKIIRNTANFSNLYYIVAYDKTYLNEVIGNDISNPEQYLEKIFNMEVTLPAFEQDILLIELENLLKNALENSIDKAKLDELIKTIRNEANLDYFQNFRDIKRFVNTFVSSIKMIQKTCGTEEVNLSDFFNLELLKFHFLPIYLLLIELPNPILTNGNQGRFILANDFKDIIKRMATSPEITKFINDRIGSKKTENEISNMPNEKINLSNSIFSFNDKDNKNISILLNKLFGNEHNYIFPQSIQFKESYFKYFAFRSHKDGILAQDFIAALDDNREGYFVNWLRDKKDSAIYHNFRNIIDMRYDFRLILQGLLIFTECSDTQANSCKQVQINFHSLHELYLVLFYNKNGTDEINKKNKDIATEILTNPKNLHAKLSLLANLRLEESILSETDTANICEKVFYNFMEETKNIEVATDDMIDFIVICRPIIERKYRFHAYCTQFTRIFSQQIIDNNYEAWLLRTITKNADFYYMQNNAVIRLIWEEHRNFELFVKFLNKKIKKNRVLLDEYLKFSEIEDTEGISDKEFNFLKKVPEIYVFSIETKNESASTRPKAQILL